MFGRAVWLASDHFQIDRRPRLLVWTVVAPGDET